MFFLVPIEKIIRIEPYELGKNLELKIRRKYSLDKLKPPPLYRIEETNIGTCHGNYGYIIHIPL